MQACPYDALYIDPDTHTAAKCNYCAHRIDIGLEPACVNVCPEEAIISGDMDDPDTKISKLLSRQQVKVRKPEKATRPNLFYIDADDASLVATDTTKSKTTLWGSQSHGVGHFVREAEKLAFSNSDVLAELVNINGGYTENNHKVSAPKSVEVVMQKATRVYDSPDKGILWGWEVSAYVWTKAIAAGAFLVPFTAGILFNVEIATNQFWISIGAALVFLAMTGILLIMDLDRPDRFLYVLLRPHWESWLVKGGYAITVYGGLLTLLALSYYFGWLTLLTPLLYVTAATAILVAIYTAFLFSQAKGRDFWQSPTLSLHMVIHAFMAGAALFLIATLFFNITLEWMRFLKLTLIISILANVVTLTIELITTHPTLDAKMTVESILNGRYKNKFWLSVIILGNILPLLLMIFSEISPLTGGLASILVLYGIYQTEHIWVEAPQRIALS
jgi:formate-dependent nitrite reductase membrane component NrfD